jgi:hypothetical protein
MSDPALSSILQQVQNLSQQHWLYEFALPMKRHEIL